MKTIQACAAFRCPSARVETANPHQIQAMMLAEEAKEDQLHHGLITLSWEFSFLWLLFAF
jgi:hypothetical protein